MANRPKGFGMTAELNRKKEAKFDVDLANEALTWLASVLRSTGSEDDGELACSIGPVSVQKDVQTPLKNGVILCRVINIIKPNSVKKVNKMSLVFKQMENIGFFLNACEQIGVNKIDLFQTVDLFEANNIPQVVNGIFALGRKTQKTGYKGPRLGPEEATENIRQFSEEQLRAGEGVIGLQAGSNKGASQAGQNFGKTRAIID